MRIFIILFSMLQSKTCMADHHGESAQSQLSCPECGATWKEGTTCESNFHQMLYWENEDLKRGAVHHLMILAYHLQHPSQYSPEGLKYSQQLLVDFVERGVTPQQVVKNNWRAVDSNLHRWGIRARPGTQASYPHPASWSLTVQDVVDADADHYVESVQAWARSIITDLRSAGNL